MWVDDDTGEWVRNTPSSIMDGALILPALLPIWNGFAILSRGRDNTSMGVPMPLKFRDIRDIIERMEWDDDSEAERLIAALDEEFLSAAYERIARQRETESR